MADGVRVVDLPLGPHEADGFAALAARVFLHDPLAEAIFDGDEGRREQRLRHVYGGMFRTLPRPPLSAWHGELGIGIAGLAPNGARPPLGRSLRALPLLLRGARPHELRPALSWVRDVAALPGVPGDWRLGPVAVDPPARGQGVGTALLAAACERLDRLRLGLLVSTDVERNVDFYTRFGFEGLGASEVAGQRVWHLRRPGR